jgi:hypothetical protein
MPNFTPVVRRTARPGQKTAAQQKPGLHRGGSLARSFPNTIKNKGVINMGDFIQNTAVKTAVRTLANPIADVAAFATIIASVIATNPFGCVSYMTAGTTHAPVEKTKESYVTKIVYQDEDAKVVGNESGKFSTVAGFNAGAAALLADAALTAAHGGTPARDSDTETYSATVKCHDPNGEIYMITFGRDQISLTSYEDDAIKTKVETWADTVAALA